MKELHSTQDIKHNVYLNPHPPNKEGSTPHLALLVPIREYLQTVCSDGEELDVGTVQECDHLLKSTGQTYGHLGSLLVQQQVVQCRDRVEQDGLDARTINKNQQIKELKNCKQK